MGIFQGCSPSRSFANDRTSLYVRVLSELEISQGGRKYLEGLLAALVAFKVTLGFCGLPRRMSRLKFMEVLPSCYFLHSTSKARISARLFLQKGSVKILIMK